MKLLAIDTATEACSAALYIAGQTHYLYEIAPRRHAELILPMVDKLLSDATITLRQLDAIAFGRGPGAFTGVRIATSVVQGLAMSSDLPVIPVSTLAALAQGALAQATAIACAIDARMGEVYWALYESDTHGISRLVGNESVSLPTAVTVPQTGHWYGVGSGWESYKSKLQQRMGKRLQGYRANDFPSAQHIITLALPEWEAGNILPPEAALPVYLRNKVTN